MGDIRKQRFIESLRSSPRKRRKVAWLVGSAVAVAALAILLVVILPNTAGKSKPAPEAAAEPQGSTWFWIVGSVLLIGFLSAIAYVVVRFVWRMQKDEVDDASRPGAYAFPNTRVDPQQLTHPTPE